MIGLRECDLSWSTVGGLVPKINFDSLYQTKKQTCLTRTVMVYLVRLRKGLYR